LAEHFVKFSLQTLSLSHGYIMRFTALSAMLVRHSALLTYNAALNRPAYQSSV